MKEDISLNNPKDFKTDAECYEDSEISPQRELTISIIDKFEDLLERNNLTIPSDDREGEESEARIFGSPYWSLEDGITKMIEESLKKKK